MKDKNNKKTTEEIVKEISEYEELAIKIKENAAAENYIDNLSYEECRDLSRFAGFVFVALMTISFILVLVSGYSLATLKDGGIYSTSRNGDVEQIIKVIKK